MTSTLTVTTTAPIETLADLLQQLGGISPARVRFRPVPGTATEQDVLALESREGRLCELVDGILVEKAVGLRESFLAIALSTLLWNFVKARRLGIITGEAGLMRLASGLVRIPDVAFISWDRLPGGRVPTEPIPDLVPDLAVEVLSAGNTSEEMARKRREYFVAGVGIVWVVDPVTRTIAVYTTPERSTVLHAEDTLDGGQLLPGFTLSVAELFRELDRQDNR